VVGLGASERGRGWWVSAQVSGGAVVGFAQVSGGAGVGFAQVSGWEQARTGACLG